MRPFLFLLGLIVVLGGFTLITIRSFNKLRKEFLGFKFHEVHA